MRELVKDAGIKKIIIFLFITAVIFWVGFCGGTGEIEKTIEASMRAFTLILWSILLEALPFVLLGTIISSLIQVFVSEETILKILPKNKFLRLVTASLIGLIFPVCECAIIPITRGLIKKGMPPGPAIAFMIATPIVIRSCFYLHIMLFQHAADGALSGGIWFCRRDFKRAACC